MYVCIYIRYIPNIHYSYIFYIRQLNPEPNCYYFLLERHGVLERALNVVWGVGKLGFRAGAMAFPGSFSAASAPSTAAPHLQRRCF